MPRKTKDFESNDIEEKEATSTKSKKNTTKKTAKTKTVKKVSNAKIQTEVKQKVEEKKSKLQSSTNTSKRKNTASKKTAASKKVEKKSTAKKTSVKKSSNKKIDIVEYYDLPYRYNQTVVKVLAQTPTNLFIYWDISDEDIQNYKKEYGNDFFETTKPVLKIYNDTMNYNFEVEINDFANSWYLHVNDSKCDYRVELGRRPIHNLSHIPVEYIYISTSNKIESPNDKILFNKAQHMVYFKNVKTNHTTSKSVATLSFIRNMGKFYNIYDLYKKIYKDEDIKNIYNPSSRFF